MNRYRQMQIFEAVMQARSLAGAARQLQRSPATIMRAIAALESRLNSRLLIRGARGVNLSPVGEQFAVHCRHILEQTEIAERCAAGTPARPAGHLTVSLPALMDQHVLTPLLLAYLNEFAQVQLSIRACHGVPRLLEEGIDVAMVIGHLPNSSDFAVQVGMASPVFCGSPGYLTQRGRPQTPNDLIAHRMVATTTSVADDEWRLRREGRRCPFKPQPVLTCTTQRAAIHAATLGLGLIRCLRYEVHQELQQGLLETVLDGFVNQPLPVQLIYRDGRRAEAKVRSFIAFATPRLRSHPAFLS